MKTLLATLSLVLAAGVGSAHAQSAVGPGALIGAVAGGVIGGHNHDRWAEGAVLGGVAGALIGAAVSPQEPVYQSGPAYYQNPPVAYQAPVTYQQPQVVYAQPAPQVVYAPAPAVVYAPAPAPVCVEPARRYYVPAVRFGFGYYSGPRYARGYDHGYYGHRYHR